jgi:hypothetical protein
MVILKSKKSEGATGTIRTLHVFALVAMLQEFCVGNIDWPQLIAIAGLCSSLWLFTCFLCCDKKVTPRNCNPLCCNSITH